MYEDLFWSVCGFVGSCNDTGRTTVSRVRVGNRNGVVYRVKRVRHVSVHRCGTPKHDTCLAICTFTCTSVPPAAISRTQFMSKPASGSRFVDGHLQEHIRREELFVRTNCTCGRSRLVPQRMAMCSLFVARATQHCESLGAACG